MNRKLSILLMGTLFLLGGCLVEETQHILYLEPDGSVTWTVLESGIHSDATDPDERWGEEEEFLSRARIGMHPIASALAQLGPYDLQSQLLRPDRPFAVHNDAWYASLEDLAREILFQLEIDGSFELQPTDEGNRFVLTMIWHDGDVEDEETVDGLLPLMAELEDYKVVLAEGKFVEALGFEIVEGGTAAIPIELTDDEVGEGDVLVYSLTWSLD